MSGPSKKEFAEFIEGLADVQFARLVYCECISTTFIKVHLFEHAITNAMLLCDQVAVSSVLGKDAKTWERVQARYRNLQASTLGSLIKLLERHGFDPIDIRYLKWLKNKRDAFIHRLFHTGAWPGDLNQEDCERLCRKLQATQVWLDRGTVRIWRIFEKAGLVRIDDLGENGLLVINSDLTKNESG